MRKHKINPEPDQNIAESTVDSSDMEDAAPPCTVFSMKLSSLRKGADLTQQEFADQIGISKRAVAAYESQNILPRKSTLRKIAAVLHVSVKYLADDACTDPLEDLQKDNYPTVNEVLRKTQKRRDMAALLSDLDAFFADDSYTQEQKDSFLLDTIRMYYLSGGSCNTFASLALK